MKVTHRPSVAPALGLRAGAMVVSSVKIDLPILGHEGATMSYRTSPVE